MFFLPALSPSALTATVLNRLLRRQAWAQEVLRVHAGKAVRVQTVGPAAWVLALRVQESGQLAPWGTSAPADVVLTVRRGIPPDNLTAVLDAALNAINNRHVRHEQTSTGEALPLAGQVHIEGEAALAQAVLTLAQHLRWDPEDELARWLGDRAAVTLMGLLKEAGRGTRRAAVHLAENLGEYLSHENPLLLARVPFEDWVAQVQGLAQRLDVLESAMAGLKLPSVGPPPC